MADLSTEIVGLLVDNKIQFHYRYLLIFLEDCDLLTHYNDYCQYWLEPV